jgi:hypothetical protein
MNAGQDISPALTFSKAGDYFTGPAGIVKQIQND